MASLISVPSQLLPVNDNVCLRIGQGEILGIQMPAYLLVGGVFVPAFADHMPPGNVAPIPSL
ncbi:MAG: hypothetical protein KC418_12850 [Anaerolineales bacterium]|nr:hypothetical protein [Anaerolineales bacterium]